MRFSVFSGPDSLGSAASCQLSCRPHTNRSDAFLHELSRAEDDALLALLRTPTLAGVIATLEYAASRCPFDDDTIDDDVYASLAEIAQYESGGDGDPSDTLNAAEQFPATVAAALRQIMADKSL
jgi:hypothetical protein